MVSGSSYVWGHKKKRKPFRRFFRLISRPYFFIPFLILFLVVLWVFLFYSKDCENSEKCFSLRIAECKPAHVLVNKQGASYEYAVKGKYKEDCILSIRLLQLDPAAGSDLKKLLEGKSMVCGIPQSMLKESIFELDNINSYCTGPLKEVGLEISIQKMYEIVIENLGPIASEFKTSFGSF